ncbi:MAG: hypothetical protein H5U18_02950 [Rhodobacteraceae bacterium]|nr:hypothetical protein [Paracoccaceae bacterium]
MREARAQAALVPPGSYGSGRDTRCEILKAPITGTVLSVDIVSETPVTSGKRRLSVEPLAHSKVSALGIEEQRVDAVCDLASPPEARAGIGDRFAVCLRIVTWEGDGVMQVPLSAPFRRAGGWAVFRAVDGVARLTPVTIGHRNGTAAKVTGGLEPGDRVILLPSDAIADDTPITERTTPG